MFLLCFSSAIQAQPITSGQFVHTEIRVRPVPAGIGFVAKTGYQRSLYRNKHLALERNGIELGGLVQASPVSLHPGIYLKLTPLTILELESGLQALTYFGILNSALTYNTREGNWSARGRERQRSKVGVRPGVGWSAFGIARLKLKVSALVGVSEFEIRRLNLNTPSAETWYDPERHQLLLSSDVYHRSLTILGWMLGKAIQDSDLIAGLWWREWSELNTSDRNLVGLGWVRQRQHQQSRSRWLVLVATYVRDIYQTGELFGALVWQRSWLL